MLRINQFRRLIRSEFHQYSLTGLRRDIIAGLTVAAVCLPLALAYGIAGIGLMVAAFKIFDWMTPGDLGKEILEKGNLAAAILATGFLLAVALIVAAAFA